MESNNYFNHLLERLQWTVSDNYSLESFFQGDVILASEKKLQSCTEFFYRILRCKLIQVDWIFNEEFWITNNLSIPEVFAEMMIKYPHYKLYKPSNEFADEMQLKIWLESYFIATEKLESISDRCRLDRGDYPIDMSDERWIQFDREIRKVFLENGVPWDIEHPLFPIDKTRFNIDTGGA
ncbi:hypothetical protein [Neisseria iguanae]|uniref:Uncharacterized protein n=1 Tax=Neisseria iguanae TaxID=90242 RepID=A0A2P7U3B1_9NEIS|nr:hypothetical protein [Neisseria iguanae]PSJ81436.1 hypothetical protein C7N83_00660 [Neisseria iguanae]